MCAARLLSEAAQTDEARLDAAFERALARKPKAEEKAALLKYLAEQTAYFRGHPEAATKVLTIGQAPRPDVVPIIDRYVSAEVRRIHRGVLDGLSQAEIAARYKPRGGEPEGGGEEQTGDQRQAGAARHDRLPPGKGGGSLPAAAAPTCPQFGVSRGAAPRGAVFPYCCRNGPA